MGGGTASGADGTLSQKPITVLTNTNTRASKMPTSLLRFFWGDSFIARPCDKNVLLRACREIRQDLISDVKLLVMAGKPYTADPQITKSLASTSQDFGDSCTAAAA